jgi:hypothetical protein
MQYVDISPDLHPYLGELDPGTRVYKSQGSQEEAGRWYDAVTAAVGPTISLGAVQLYCPVSRSALHDRIERGKLTVFEFTVTERRTNFLGQNKTIKKDPFSYVPVSECRSWRKDIEERAKEKGMTEADIAKANSSRYDALDVLVVENEDKLRKSRPATLEIPLNQYYLDKLKYISKALKYETPGNFVADLLKPIVEGGFSGLSCAKAGWWLAGLLEKHKVGKVHLSELIKDLKQLKS